MRISSKAGKKSLYFCWILAAVALVGQSGCGSKEEVDGKPQFTPDRMARVNFVIDGDTLDLEDGERIRFLGIDAPEIWKRRGDQPDEPWGRDAANFVHLLLPPGSEIGLIFEPAARRDAYNRTLAYVIFNGEMLNALLLQEGYAVYRDFGTALKHGEYLKRMEGQGKVYGKGLWAGQGRLAAPRYFLANRQNAQYYDPEGEAAGRISERNRVRLTEESARRLGLAPDRSVQSR